MSRTQLPEWRSILRVVAHPDDETFGLGAVLAAFAEARTVIAKPASEASTPIDSKTPRPSPTTARARSPPVISAAATVARATAHLAKGVCAGARPEGAGVCRGEAGPTVIIGLTFPSEVPRSPSMSGGGRQGLKA